RWLAGGAHCRTPASRTGSIRGRALRRRRLAGRAPNGGGRRRGRGRRGREAKWSVRSWLSLKFEATGASSGKACPRHRVRPKAGPMINSGEVSVPAVPKMRQSKALKRLLLTPDVNRFNRKDNRPPPKLRGACRPFVRRGSGAARPGEIEEFMPDALRGRAAKDLRQLVVAVAEPLEAHRKSDALFGGLKDDEGRGRAGPQLLDQGLVHDHFGDAAARKAAHEAGPPDIDLVDLQPEPGRQQHAHRGDHAHQPALLIGGLEHDHGDA